MSSKQRTQGASVAPYIYEYAPHGTLQGYQVRFKRTPAPKRPESRSAYFSISTWGNADAAFRQAERWRDRNASWMDDVGFALRPIPASPRRARSVA